LKGDLFNRALFFTVAAYEIKRQNVGFVWNPDSLSAVQLEDLINPNNLTPTSPTYRTVTTSIVGSERRTVNSAEESRGFDLTLQAKRTHGLQARVTASAVRVRSQPDFASFKAVLDDAVTRTNAATAPGGDITMAENATSLANAKTIYDSAAATTKVSGLRSAPYSGSFVLDYEMPKLKGLRLGLTGVLTPDYNVGIFNGLAYRAGARFPLSFYAIYHQRIGRARCTFRVGAQSFYDLVNGSSDYRKTGTTGFNTAAQVPNYVYRYVDPVSYSASVTTRF
jgi:hypothetical protein